MKNQNGPCLRSKLDFTASKKYYCGVTHLQCVVKAQDNVSRYPKGEITLFNLCQHRIKRNYRKPNVWENINFTYFLKPHLLCFFVVLCLHSLEPRYYENVFWKTFNYLLKYKLRSRHSFYFINFIYFTYLQSFVINVFSSALP